MTALRFSDAPFGDPGRLTTRADPSVPAAAPRQRRHGCLLQPAGDHGVNQAGSLSVEHRPGGLGSDVSYTETRASGGDDEVGLLCADTQGGGYIGLLVGHHETSDVVPGLRE